MRHVAGVMAGAVRQWRVSGAGVGEGRSAGMRCGSWDSGRRDAWQSGNGGGKRAAVIEVHYCRGCADAAPTSRNLSLPLPLQRDCFLMGLAQR